MLSKMSKKCKQIMMRNFDAPTKAGMEAFDSVVGSRCARLATTHESHDSHISSGTLEYFLLMAFHTLSLLHFPLPHFQRPVTAVYTAALLCIITLQLAVAAYTADVASCALNGTWRRTFHKHARNMSMKHATRPCPCLCVHCHH